jgi:hypothetical protein
MSFPALAAIGGGAYLGKRLVEKRKPAGSAAPAA